jgi:hypothetical protein
MNLFAAILFLAVGIALIAARRPAARMQAMLAGGTIRPGCAVAEGVVFIVLAAAVWLLWDRL